MSEISAILTVDTSSGKTAITAFVDHVESEFTKLRQFSQDAIDQVSKNAIKSSSDSAQGFGDLIKTIRDNTGSLLGSLQVLHSSVGNLRKTTLTMTSSFSSLSQNIKSVDAAIGNFSPQLIAASSQVTNLSQTTSKVKLEKISGGAKAASGGMKALGGAMKAIAWVGIATAVIDIGTALWDMFTAVDETTKRMREFKEETNKNISSIETESIKSQALIDTYFKLREEKDLNSESSSRLQTVTDELAGKYPELAKYIKDLSTEYSGLSEAMEIAAEKSKIEMFTKMRGKIVDELSSVIFDSEEFSSRKKSDLIERLVTDPDDLRDYLKGKRGERYKIFLRNIEDSLKDLMEIDERLEGFGLNIETLKQAIKDKFNEKLSSIKEEVSRAGLPELKQLLAELQAEFSKTEGFGVKFPDQERADVKNYISELEELIEKHPDAANAAKEHTNAQENLNKSAKEGSGSWGFLEGIIGFFTQIIEKRKEIENSKNDYFKQFGNEAERTSAIINSELIPNLDAINQKIEILGGSKESQANARFSVFADSIKTHYPEVAGQLDNIKDKVAFMEQFDGKAPKEALAGMVEELNKMQLAEDKFDYIMKFGNDAERTAASIDSLAKSFAEAEAENKRLGGTTEQLANNKFQILTDKVGELNPELVDQIKNIKDIDTFMNNIDLTDPTTAFEAFRAELEKMKAAEDVDQKMKDLAGTFDKELMPGLKDLKNQMDDNRITTDQFKSSATEMVDSFLDTLKEKYPDLAFYLDELKKKAQEFIETASDKDNSWEVRLTQFSNWAADASDSLFKVADIASVFDAEWAQAIANVAEGFNDLSNAAANFASGNWLSGIQQGMLGLSSIYSGLFGRGGIFGSGKHDDAHVAGFARGLGIDAPDVVAQGQQRTQQLRDQGYDKFAARTIAEMEMIPGLVDAAGKLNDMQMDKMLWKILHGVDKLGGGFKGWKEAMPSVVALLGQVEQGHLKWNETIEAGVPTIGGHIEQLTQFGLLTDEIFSVVKEHASDDYIKRLFDDISIGIDKGTVSVGDFGNAMSMLMAEADERKLDVTDQLHRIFSSAAGAGWEMEDITSQLQLQIDAYEKNLENLNSQIDDLNKQIDGMNQQIGDAEWSQYKFKEFTLPKAEKALSQYIDDLMQSNRESKNALRQQWKEEEDPRERRKLRDKLDNWENENKFVYTKKTKDEEGNITRERFRNHEAFEAINKTINEFTKDRTQSMTFEQMKQIAESVNPEAREQVVQYLDTVQQGLRAQEQIDLMKEQRDQLIKNRKDLMAKKNEEIRKLDRMKDALVYIQNHWQQLVDAAKGKGGGGGNNGDGQDSKQGDLYTGGIVNNGLYQLGELGPEYVMSNSALNKYGLDFMKMVNEGRYTPQAVPMPVPIPVSQPVMAPIAVEQRAEQQKVEVVVRKEGDTTLKIQTKLNDQEIGEKITYELVNDRIRPLLEEGGRLRTE